MRVKYDRTADAAYIYLVNAIGFGHSTKQYHCDFKKIGGIINLDFDSDGRLLGIEVLDASRFLAKDTLDNAEIVD